MKLPLQNVEQAFSQAKTSIGDCEPSKLFSNNFEIVSTVILLKKWVDLIFRSSNYCRLLQTQLSFISKSHHHGSFSFFWNIVTSLSTFHFHSHPLCLQFLARLIFHLLISQFVRTLSLNAFSIFVQHISRLRGVQMNAYSAWHIYGSILNLIYVTVTCNV